MNTASVNTAMKSSNLRARYWRARFARWGRTPAEHRPGYSLLVPVPGDLPVFLELALAVCRLQDPTNRVETLVIPDLSTPAMHDIVDSYADDWPGRLELLRLPAVDRVVLPRLRDPGRNHGAQLIRGVTRARGSHIVLHDADLFLLDPRVHADEFILGLRRDLDVTGISGAWDPWYARRGRELVATWEQCGRVEWYRSFPPHRHLGHDAMVDGELHTFDTTFWPQLHSRAASLAVGPGFAERVVHFNYTISTYRAYQRSVQQSAGPFRDNNFRLLLIRLFVELFARAEHAYGLPSLEQLAAGLSRGDAPVHYAPEDGATYRQLRAQLGEVVVGPWSSPARAARCQELLAAFDAHFAIDASRW